jgi:hypothetical protein
MVDDMVELLTHTPYRDVDFGSLRHHIPDLKDLTLEEFKAALFRYKESTPHAGKYKKPHLQNELPYLILKEEGTASEDVDLSWLKEIEDRGLKRSRSFVNQRDSVLLCCDVDVEQAKEFRRSFISLLQYEYEQQIQHGELDCRNGFVCCKVLNSRPIQLPRVIH